MKSILTLFLISFQFLFAATASANNQYSAPPSDSTIVFHVAGVCEMCKKRIETAAMGKGVTIASWDMQGKHLTVTYNPARTKPGKIKARISDAGYDTDSQKADDRTYTQLPECCRYREFSSMEEMYKMQTDTIVVMEVDTTDKAAGALAILPAEVYGTVSERDKDGQLKPLQGASVVWLGTGMGTSTDSTGSFRLNRKSEQQKLVISYVGLQTDTVTVNHKGEVQAVLSSGKNLQAIRVSAGGRPSVFVSSYEPVRKIIISQKELQKAACCNLSESFETNPSVDVSFNDAVTGSKQIQLLGLSGNYTQLTVENMPGPRGLATAQGLNFIPGTWIESIQLVKGTGSVANGFESMAGQINVELKKPQTSERLYANAYVNDFGKTDLNLNLSQKVGQKWGTTLLLHNAFLNNSSIDFNGDGFRDLPTGNLFSAVNRWQFTNNKGLTAHMGVKFLDDRKTGGQTIFNPTRHKFSTDVYGLQIDTRRAEAFGKIGYVFPEKLHKSIGLQVSAFRHEQDSYFGLTTYDGEQKNLYSNLIYQSHIGSDRHRFRTGISLVYDQYREAFNTQDFQRNEAVSGGFFEYTFSPSTTFNLVAGVREDYNSLYGWFTTPRLHVRYQPFTGTVIRGSVGRGQRTANIFAENNSVLVSSRSVNILTSTTGKAYGLNPEVAWNKGVSVDQKLRLFNRAATISAEFFRNDFSDQVVVDMEDPSEVRFYNLQGDSYANSFQSEVSFEPLRKLTLRLAYRYFDVKTTYGNQLLQRPFTAKHRGFANLAYEISNWKFDYTLSANGRKRLPSTTDLPETYKRDAYAPAYTVMNAQISKTLGKNKNIDLYIGGENLTNFFQKDVITAAEQPFSKYFDASQVWGPVNGRMLYGGFRFTLK
ncbi:TonB-dependent receptor [Flavisolibacter sp. BT320]|nr:TonB-dependent receptor [Flavisolibacter longurius]